MAIYDLRINHLDRPFGLHVLGNSFSFLADEEGPFVAEILLEGKVIKSKEVSLADCVAFDFGNDFLPGKEYVYRVHKGENEACLSFETAATLEAPFIKPEDKSLFTPIFTKSFHLENKPIAKARLTITGLGLYLAKINGKKVGDRYLAPGCNDYDAYLRYQTYDVAELLEQENRIEVHMGDGWYKGRFGIDKPLDKGGNVFGEEYKLCAQLDIVYADGSSCRVQTGADWLAEDSAIVATSIYDGETQDYAKALEPSKKVLVSEESYVLTPDFGSGVVCKEILKPTLYVSPKGEKILDFGQNMVGFIRVNRRLEKGQRLHIQHGEVLQQGCFYRDNLRTAKAEMTYVGDGNKGQFEPEFTYFGFRYAKIEGIEDVDPSQFEGVVLYTDLRDTLSCKTSAPKINQLLHNAYWGQRGNFLDVPTDCPQRDERLGWTADTQVFLPTACYQMDCYNFYKKYLHDLRYDQVLYYQGDFPMYSPSLKGEAGHGGAVWADAGTIIPWELYRQYGDKGLLGYSYAGIKDYVATLFEKDQSQGDRGLILYGFTFGDWLAQDGVCAQSLMGGTDNGFIMSVYYYHSVDIAYLAAKELGLDEDAKVYQEKKEKIYNAILDEYFAPNGKLALDTQTAYVLALRYGIYRNKERVVSDFRARLRKDFYRMKTGFTGTPLLLPTLFDNGMDDDAYRMLFNEECPGWIYAINLGATTIWERWNSLLPDGTISGTNMNSLNHYSYGAVCEAIYSRIAGLSLGAVGWKKAVVRPHPNYRLKAIDLCFDSPSGQYRCGWKVEGERFILDLTVPFGCEAEVELPNGEAHSVGAGNHHFDVAAPESLLHPFSLDTPNLDILANEEANAAMKRILPQAYAMVTGENDEFKIDTGRFLGFLAMFGTTKESMAEYEAALAKIAP